MSVKDSAVASSPTEQFAPEKQDNQFVLEEKPKLPQDSKTPTDQKKPYSIYTPSEKWFIVGVSSFAALFSPFTANIYFPAIPTLAAVFHESIELINLTVTVFMIVQGISPMFWGTLSDRVGRRPVALACMIVLSLSCVGLALVPTDAYYGLMLLRCLQAAGSASTVALGAGIIADIAAAHERGTFFGVWNIGPMVGPCIGPVIGGALSDGLGWRSIFWFLCIASAVCFVIILLLLPETLRALVGDGSVPPPHLYKPLVPILGRKRTVEPDYSTRPPPRSFQNPLKLFLYPDVTLLLLFNAVIYAVFYGVTASISTLYQDTYPFLNETDIGLCFLAIGGGMLIGGVITGKVLDREYRTIRESMMRAAEKETDPEKMIRPEDVMKDEYFPIEKARLRLLPVYFVIFVAATVGYGWALDKKVSIAGPLILQIILGYATVSCFNVVQTLIVDLVPAQSSAITACNNLVRCSFGAVLVSVINLILNGIGTGWTYVLLAGISLIVAPIMPILLYMGPEWRARRRARRAASGS